MLACTARAIQCIWHDLWVKRWPNCKFISKLTRANKPYEGITCAQHIQADISNIFPTALKGLILRKLF